MPYKVPLVVFSISRSYENGLYILTDFATSMLRLGLVGMILYDDVLMNPRSLAGWHSRLVMAASRSVIASFALFYLSVFCCCTSSFALFLVFAAILFGEILLMSLTSFVAADLLY